LAHVAKLCLKDVAKLCLKDVAKLCLKDVAEKCSFLDFIVGDNEEDKIKDWSGMAPSDCWVDNGISNVRGLPAIMHCLYYCVLPLS
jgi:hypothetical protein